MASPPEQCQVQWWGCQEAPWHQVHSTDLLGELEMCGSKKELCLQLLCTSVSVHHCHSQKHQNARVGSRIQVNPLTHHRSCSPE